jgi:hypothetical protein
MSARLDQAIADWCRSPERELMLLLGRVEITEDCRERISTLLPNGVRVEQFLGISDRHYVLPLAVRQLLQEAEIPSDTLEPLEHLLEERAVRSRQLADEMLQIVSVLEREGIPVVPYKGPLLGHLLYGDFALRPCIDLDFLVRRSEAQRAKALLFQQGYQPIRQLTQRQERATSRAEIHYELVRKDPEIAVDLHWRLLPDYACIRFDSDALLARAEKVSVAGVTVRTFRPEDQLLILSAHAAKHYGERFIWFNDFAQLIKLHPDMDWPWVLAEAGRLGIQRILRVCLRLAERLLGVDLPDRVRDDLRTDPAADPLAARVLRSFWTVPLDGASWAEKIRGSLLVRERWKDRAGYLLGLTWVYLTPTSNDWETVRLPERLFFLHYVLRPFRISLKYARSFAGRLRNGERV